MDGKERFYQKKMVLLNRWFFKKKKFGFFSAATKLVCIFRHSCYNKKKPRNPDKITESLHYARLFVDAHVCTL